MEPEEPSHRKSEPCVDDRVSYPVDDALKMLARIIAEKHTASFSKVGYRNSNGTKDTTQGSTNSRKRKN